MLLAWNSAHRQCMNIPGHAYISHPAKSTHAHRKKSISFDPPFCPRSMYHTHPSSFQERFRFHQISLHWALSCEHLDIVTKEPVCDPGVLCKIEASTTALLRGTTNPNKIMTYKAANLVKQVKTISGHWQPQHLLTLNNSHSLKLAQIKGPFIWHCHPDTDEVFYCVSGGPFKIELATNATSSEDVEKVGADEVVELSVGDMFCIPKGMQHRPVADVETGILLIEKVGTVNTGDREGDGMTSYVNENVG